MSLRPTIPLLAGRQPPFPRSLRSKIKVLEASRSLPSPPLPTPGMVPPRGGYRVVRSANGALPVYSDLRNDGTWKTVIRKIEGDVASLKDELNQYFRTIHVDPLRDPPKAVLRPTNGHLVVKGNWVNEIRAYMAEQGL